MDQVLITGSNGFIGRHLASALESDYLVHGMDVCGHCEFKASVTDKKRVEQAFKKTSPKIVFHTAAVKDISLSQGSPEAWEVNFTSTKNIAGLCARYNSKLVFISSDIVFNGKKGGYSEEDPVSPVNDYGRAKAESEKAINDSGARHLICRTAMVYGRFQNPLPRALEKELLQPMASNQSFFVEHAVRRLSKGLEVQAFEDVYSSPTHVLGLCEQVKSLVKKECSGVFHTAGPEKVSRYGFALEAARAFGLDESLVSPVSCPENSLRPRDVSLNVSKLVRSTGFKPKTVKRALAEMKKQMVL